MTQQEALQLVQRVELEVPLIHATVDDSRPGKDGTGYRVRLELCDRVLYANHADDLDSIKHAWQWLYLPEEQCLVPKRDDKVRYLVDGIPVVIKQDRRGNWRATYKSHDGKIRGMYWGKEDPRGRYPVLGEREIIR